MLNEFHESHKLNHKWPKRYAIWSRALALLQVWRPPRAAELLTSRLEVFAIEDIMPMRVVSFVWVGVLFHDSASIFQD
jgi:hypothetical protein